MKKTISILVLLLSVLFSNAEPADPSLRRTIKLEDGSVKVAQLIGDEYGHYWRAIDDGSCYIEKKNVIGTFVKVKPESIVEKARKRRKVASASLPWKVLSHNGFPCTRLNLTGQKKILALLVEFQDVRFNENYVSKFNSILNEHGYKEGSFVGSVSDYFYSQSNGKFDLTFDVVGPIRVSKNSSYYGKNPEVGGIDEHMGDAVEDALNQIGNDINLSNYTWDNNYVVDQILVIYAGAGEEYTGNTDNIWAHESIVNKNVGNISVQRYACASELRKDYY